MTPALSSRAPSGPLATRWARYRDALALVGPTRRRHHSVLVVGAGLAGASAAATLSELGYRVRCLVFHDSPRRAHSVAAQGGINAAKNYQNDGDSVERLFHDTLEGGDFRSREANVYRLAELSTRIIDHAVAQGVPFAREYGGHLANRSFGGALVSRTFYARGQTGQQLLLGAYGALAKEEAAGGVTVLARREMLDLIVVDGRARGVVARDLVSGALEVHLADAVVLATGGYANVYFLSTNAKASNATAIWRAHRRGAAFANPGFVQFHPTCLPAAGEHQAKLTLMSESLRNDGRLWVPLRPGDERRPEAIPEAERDYFLERRYPRYGNLVPRDLGSRACKALVDEGRGVGPGGRGVYLDLTDAARRGWAPTCCASATATSSSMYEHITGDDPLRGAMRIAPAAHYSMGGLWVDYDLMSTIPGLFVDRRGELLGPGREPARRQRADAGAGRRLLHPALHAGRLPRRGAAGRRRRGRPGGARRRWPRCGRAWRRCSACGAGAPRPTSTARWAACCGRRAGSSAAARGSPRRSTRWRRCARRSGRT